MVSRSECKLRMYLRNYCSFKLDVSTRMVLLKRFILFNFIITVSLEARAPTFAFRRIESNWKNLPILHNWLSGAAEQPFLLCTTEGMSGSEPLRPEVTLKLV